MTKEKCLEAIHYYEEWVPNILASSYSSNLNRNLEHVLNMIPQMKEFLEENRMEKFMRWLGFIQGVLWVHEIYTLDELMEHNRP